LPAFVLESCSIYSWRNPNPTFTLVLFRVRTKNSSIQLRTCEVLLTQLSSLAQMTLKVSETFSSQKLNEGTHGKAGVATEDSWEPDELALLVDDTFFCLGKKKVLKMGDSHHRFGLSECLVAYCYKDSVWKISSCRFWSEGNASARNCGQFFMGLWVMTALSALMVANCEGNLGSFHRLFVSKWRNHLRTGYRLWYERRTMFLLSMKRN